MKLLIITQKVDENDDVLGFFVEWIRRLAGKVKQISVICLFKGEYNLPDNVKVFSLGKEKHKSKLKYLFRFYKYIWQLRNDYDSIFIHMNPQYVILGAPLWKIWGKKIVLWYAHGYVPQVLKWADRFTDVALASTPEGYRVAGTNKLKIIGQGIDTERFKPTQYLGLKTPDSFKIISVGRITPSKDYETLIEAVGILKSGNTNFKIEIAGQPATQSDIQYLEKLKKMIDNKTLSNIFKFVGSIANKNLPPFLQSANLFVNMSHTGSLDKAILEAMACGLPILTCNEAFENILDEYHDQLMYPKRDSGLLAQKIDSVIKMPTKQTEDLSLGLRKIVIENHSLNRFVNKLLEILS